MSFLDRLRGAARELTRPQANTITESRDLERSILAAVQGAVAGVSVTDTAGSRQRAVATCIRVVSEDIASIPLRIVRQRGLVQEVLSDHPVARLMGVQPNDYMTGFELRELLTAQMETFGNGYALKVFGFGQRLVELVPLDPARTTVEYDELRGSVSYVYMKKDGSRSRFSRKDILHIKGPSADGIKGWSTIQHFRATIGEAMAQQQHANNTFANGARPSLAIQASPGVKIGKESREALQQDFKTLNSGVENWHHPVFVPDGLELKPISMNAADAQFIEQRKFTRSEIAGIFRVPPHKIGDLERATFSNIEHQEIAYVTGSLGPRCERIGSCMKRDLLADEADVQAVHDVDHLIRGDAKSQAESMAIKRRNGVINANEWRASLGLNPRTDQGGDEYIVERNMGPQGTGNEEGNRT